MRFPLKFLYWALVIGHCSFALGAFAQAPADAPPKPAKLRFLFLDETPGTYAIKTNTGYLQVSATPYSISSPYTPPDTLGRLDIYKTNPVPDPVTGKTTRLKIASLPTPADTTAAIVIVTPRPPSEPGATPVYGVELIDSDPKTFPPGSIRIINRARAPMGAQFGSINVVVAPGESKVVHPSTDPRHRVFSKIATRITTGWKLISDNITILRPDERLIGIFVYSPSGLAFTRTPLELAESGPPPPGNFWLTCSDTP